MCHKDEEQSGHKADREGASEASGEGCGEGMVGSGGYTFRPRLRQGGGKRGCRQHGRVIRFPGSREFAGDGVWN